MFLLCYGAAVIQRHLCMCGGVVAPSKATRTDEEERGGVVDATYKILLAFQNCQPYL